MIGAPREKERTRPDAKLGPSSFDGPPKFFAVTDLMVSVVVPSGKLTTAPFGAFTVMVN
jgi:hypothetical protein